MGGEVRTVMCEYSQRIGKWVTEAEGRTGSQLVINVRVCQHFCLNFFFSVHSAASAVSAPWRDLSMTPRACCPRQAHDPKAQQAGRKVCAPHLPGSGSVHAGILTSRLAPGQLRPARSLSESVAWLTTALPRGLC